MRRTAFFVLLSIILFPVIKGQGVLPGIVTIQNSGNQPIAGAVVKAGLTNKALSSADGTFAMTLPGKAPGYEVRVNVQYEGMEVVNKKDVARFALRADPSQRLKIYMCPLGQWESFALQHYQINAQKITASYEEKVDEIRRNLGEESKRLRDSLAALARERDIALAEAEKLAEIFNIANLDDASELFKEAFGFFQRGQMDSALAVLDEQRLDDMVARARKAQAQGDQLIAQGQAKKDSAAKDLREIAQGYALRARMLISKFKPQEGSKTFAKAVALDSTDFELNFEYAQFLLEQKKYRAAQHQFEKALTRAGNEEEKARTLRLLGRVLAAQFDYNGCFDALGQSNKIYESLAEKDPEVYQLEVAHTQFDLGYYRVQNETFPIANHYFESALKAVRSLAIENTEAYLPDFVDMLNRIAAIGLKHSKIENTGRVLESAEKYSRLLAANNPEKHRPSLAIALGHLGTYFSERDTGRAAVCFHEALAIDRELARKNPEAHLPALADQLKAFGAYCSQAGDSLRGEHAYEEALQIQRTLAGKEPGRYLPEVVSTLRALSEFYYRQDDSVQCLQSLDEAKTIQKDLALSNPSAHLPALAEIYYLEAAIYNVHRNYAAAVRAYEEALRIHRLLAEDEPRTFNPAVAANLNNLALVYLKQGQEQKHLITLNEALVLYRELAQDQENRTFYLPRVAITLDNLGYYYRQKKDFAQALPYYQESAAILRSLADASVEYWGVKAAQKLITLGRVYKESGDKKMAKKCWKEAQDYLDKSPMTDAKWQAQTRLEVVRN